MPRNLHQTADFWRLRPVTRETLLILWMAADNNGGIDGKPGAIHQKLNTPGTTRRLSDSLNELSEAGHVVLKKDRIQLSHWEKTIPARLRRDFSQAERKQGVAKKNPTVGGKSAMISNDVESKQELAEKNPTEEGGSPSRARVIDPSDQLNKVDNIPPIKPPPGGSEFESRKRVFLEWQESFGKKRARFKSGDSRDSKIKTRLKSFTIEQLVTCIRGYAADPWRHGAPVRHELATLLRNDVQVENGIELHNTGGRHGRSGKQNSGDFRSIRGRANRTIGYTDADRSSSPGVRDPARDSVRDDDAGRDEVQGDREPRPSAGLPF